MPGATRCCSAMLRDGLHHPGQMDDALKVTWGQMNPSRITSVLREPHFSFRVQREAESILAALGVANPAEAVRTGGYRITSTLDYRLQQVAHNQVKTWVNALGDKNVHNGALVAIDSATGEIVAYIGSVDYYDRKDPRVDGQFDVAGLGLRQPGSAFKPIVYSSAFRARRPRRAPSSSTRSRSSAPIGTPATCPPTPTSRTTVRCWLPTRCATRSTSRR